MTITLPPSAKADLLNRLADNPTERTLDRLAGDLGLMLPEAKALVQKHGWPRPESMRRAAQVLVNPNQGRAPVALATATNTATPSTDTIAAALERAKGHRAKRVQAAGVKAEAAIKRVRDLLDQEAAKYRARADAEAKKAAARADVERLERQLREAKAKLRGKKEAAPSSSGTPAKVVRAWAAENGVTCPTVGRVPASVVEAYEAAQGRAS